MQNRGKGQARAVNPNQVEIKIFPFLNDWKRDFQRESKILRTELGEHIYGVEHIGSTSIPEMSGRPVVDILVGVEDFAAVEKAEGILAEMGYARSSGPAGMEGMLFVNEGNPSYHLHFVAEHRLEATPYVRFRDLLAADPELAKQYKELKIRLVRKNKFDARRYAEGKSNWIQGVLAQSGSQAPPVP